MNTFLSFIQKIQLKQPEKNEINLSHSKTLLTPEYLTIKDHYDTLVLSGGGHKGIIHLGFLYALHQKKGEDFFKGFKSYYGTSIGSIICLLLSMDFTALDIFVEVCKSKVNPTEELNIPNFIMNFGFCSSSKLFEHVSKMIFNKFGKIPSLKELFELTGKEVYIVSHNLNENKAVYFHHSTHENLSCIEAIRMSCNIPIIFEKIVYEDCHYIDGAFSKNGHYPIKYACSFENNKNILAIKVGKSNKENDNKTEWGLLTYLYKIAKIWLRSTDEDFSCDKMDSICLFINEDKKEWDLTFINTTYKFSLFSIGYNEGIKLLLKNVSDKELVNNVDKEDIKEFIDNCVLIINEDDDKSFMEENIYSPSLKHKKD